MRFAGERKIAAIVEIVYGDHRVHCDDFAKLRFPEHALTTFYAKTVSVHKKTYNVYYYKIQIYVFQ